MIGHRGASAVAPENTLAAFRRAMEDGADGVEFDVRLSADGVPVVIHDATLRRTGLRPGVVCEMTADELRQVDAGSWFNRARPDLARKEYTGEHISSLDEVFQLFRTGPDRFSEAKLYVEMKTDHAEASTGDLARAVGRSVLAHKLAHRVVVLAFHLEGIAELKRISSVVRTGALFQPRLTPLMRKEELISSAMRAGANEIALHRVLATRRTVAAAIEHGLDVVVWAVNNPRWKSRTRDWGVNAVITDNPASLRTART